MHHLSSADSVALQLGFMAKQPPRSVSLHNVHHPIIGPTRSRHTNTSTRPRTSPLGCQIAFQKRQVARCPCSNALFLRRLPVAISHVQQVLAAVQLSTNMIDAPTSLATLGFSFAVSFKISSNSRGGLVILPHRWCFLKLDGCCSRIAWHR